MSEPKYMQGSRVKSMAHLEKLMEKELFFKFYGKTLHISFIQSMQYRTLQNVVRNGGLYTAKPIKEKR